VTRRRLARIVWISAAAILVVAALIQHSRLTRSNNGRVVELAPGERLLLRRRP
jgi:hypothetical protein